MSYQISVILGTSYKFRIIEQVHTHYPFISNPLQVESRTK